MATTISNIRLDSRGAALVELAICFLLLVLMVFGGMQYGWMFYRLHQLNDAAREGARQAVLPDTMGGDVDTRVATLMSAFDIGGYTVTVTPSDYINAQPGDIVTVTVQAPYANVQLLDLTTTLFPAPAVLTGSVSMAKEGPRS